MINGCFQFQTVTCAACLYPQVLLSGLSYEASAGLHTLSRHPKAVKGCLAQYPFWQALLCTAPLPLSCSVTSLSDAHSFAVTYATVILAVPTLQR